MALASSQELQRYAGYCPGCGGKLGFATPFRHQHTEAVQASCTRCDKRWSMVFDLDSSGTFGVMSFQCDNEDRIMGVT